MMDAIDADEYLPEERSEITRDAKEHEVFFVFNDDEHAYAFHDWWGMEGGKSFVRWLTKNREQ